MREVRKEGNLTFLAAMMDWNVEIEETVYGNNMYGLTTGSDRDSIGSWSLLFSFESRLTESYKIILMDRKNMLFRCCIFCALLSVNSCKISYHQNG